MRTTTYSGAAAIVAAAAGVAAYNSWRFSRRVAGDIEAIASPSARAPRLEWPPALPTPVERYLRKVIGRPAAIQTLRLHHRGRFRPSPPGRWLSITGEQYFRADPPAFVWWGRVRLAPGVWIDARDRSVDGTGNMLVMAESTVTIANSCGPELDQGAAGRLLAEMTWLPTAFLDTQHVRWTAVDDRRAAATLRVGRSEATGTFEFGADDLPVTFTASRYRDVGGGRSVLTPFVGRSSDFRPRDGVLVPHHMVGAWLIDGQLVDYADFVVDAFAYDVT